MRSCIPVAGAGCFPGEHADFSFRCCSKNWSDFPTWWSKVAAVISSSFVREKILEPAAFRRF
jgi:hypothetical protein